MSSESVRVLAVDLGATSVRVAAVDLAAPSPVVEVVHRYPHQPVRHDDGSLRWDWERLVAEIEHGLDVGLATGPVSSIGVDGWAVDYGLLDITGRLLSPPYSYRDGRTGGWRELAERIGPSHLYRITGIQLMAINTIFQLAAHDRSELERAHRLLLLPDLLVHHLTGFVAAERSNASTTALLDATSGGWSGPLTDAAGIPPGILPEVVGAGALAGTWRGIRVHLVGSHDTASAFTAAPVDLDGGGALVSMGTWALVGKERAEADTSPEAQAANFSNEAGAFGGVRFLKNVTGLWLLEQCRRQWGDVSVPALVDEASELPPGPVVDVNDERFLAPDDMEAEIRSAAGLSATAQRGAVVRVILDSIAEAVVGVLGELGSVTGAPVTELAVVGGGSRLGVLNRLLADRSGVPVTVGSHEATALGNAIAQGIALGRFDDPAAARTWLAPDTGRL